MSKEVFNEGPTTSQHVESVDDNHFQNTTFKLKRTRSMGLLDNFIVDPAAAGSANSSGSSSSSSSGASSGSLPSSANTNRSTLGRIQPSKLTAGTYIPEETLTRLNLKSPASSTSCSSHAAGSGSNAGNLFRSSIINKKLENSPQSFQSDDFSDDLYTSEDSLSSPGSSVHNLNSTSNICLIPKHQQKRYNQLHSHDSEDNGYYSSVTDSHNSNSQPISSNPTSPSQDFTDVSNLSNMLHDDIDVKDAPNEHVDYLTHKWAEDEISKSWKYVILRRKNVADSARLENASWRTWAQTRLGLKTISPEDLNWSKDSDVTWLYGPVIKSSNSNSNSNIEGNENVKSGSNSTTPLSPPSSSNFASSSSNENPSMSSVTLLRNHSMDNESPLIINNNTNKSYDNTSNDNTSQNNNNNNKKNANNNNGGNESTLLSIDGNDAHHKSGNQALFKTGNNSCEHLKSILKKKTKVEKMISDASYCRLQHLLENREQKLKSQHESSVSPVLEPSTSNSLNSIPSTSTITMSNMNLLNNSSNLNSRSNSTLASSKTLHSKKKSSLKNSQLHIQQNSSEVRSDSNTKKEKHIHFNMRVDQCIALAKPNKGGNNKKDDKERADNVQDDTMGYANSSDESDDYPVSKMVSSSYKEDHDHYADDESDHQFNSNAAMDDSDSDSDSDEGGFVLRPSVNKPNISHNPHENNYERNGKLSGSRENSQNSIIVVSTIAPLPATTLKFGSDDEYDNDDYGNDGTASDGSRYPHNKMYTVSHNTKTNRGYDYYYDYNTVYSNTSNPMFYSANNNANADVEMYDVPESCQIEDTMDLDDNQSHTSPNIADSPLISHMGYSLPNVHSATASPLMLPSSVSDNTMVDVPASFMNDIPQFEDDNNKYDSDIDNTDTTGQSLHIERSDMDGPTNDGLKRTRSIGSSSSRNASSQSLSSIKMGLSGLDLNTSGLRRSSATDSKPQLFQLSNDESEKSNLSTAGKSGKSFISNDSSKNNSARSDGGSGRNKFMFAESESETEAGTDDQMDAEDNYDNGNDYDQDYDEDYNGYSDHDDDDHEMIDDRSIENVKRSQTNLINAVKSASSFGSLAEINRKFGGIGATSNPATTNSKGKPRTAFSFQNDSESESE